MFTIDIAAKMRQTQRIVESVVSRPAMYVSKRDGTQLRYAGQVARASGFMDGFFNAAEHQQRHSIYWEEYGNPAGEPVIFVHGGPGGATVPSHSGFFNPDRYRIVLFHQRGCGKSTPSASSDPARGLTNNTTPLLIKDIMKLRETLHITTKMHVFGGSWGSTLSLAFAIAHPEVVASLVLRGIFLVRKVDLDYFYQGNAADYAVNPFAATKAGAYQFFPEAWRDFVNVIPVSQRGDMVKAYADIFAADPLKSPPEVAELQDKAAIAWSVWEGVTSYLAQDVTQLDKFADRDFAAAFARIENHYFMHGGFLSSSGDEAPREQNHILEQCHTLTSIPIAIVQGRFDIVCPMFGADELVAALRKAGHASVDYRVVPAGHSQFEIDICRQHEDIMDTLPVGLCTKV
jgi:proline iminopeptidase